MGVKMLKKNNGNDDYYKENYFWMNFKGMINLCFNILER